MKTNSSSTQITLTACAGPRRTTLRSAGCVTMTAILCLVAVTPPRASAQAPVQAGGTWTLVQSTWTHGVSVQVENPSQIASLSRRGGGATIQTASPQSFGSGPTQTWVHFAVPTPAVQAGVRLRLQRVNLLWDTNSVAYSLPPQPIGGYIRAVHVWDGDTKLAEFGGLSSIGHLLPSGVYERVNPLDIQGTPYVNWGIVVCILIEAPTGINLKGVGADFYQFLTSASK